MTKDILYEIKEAVFYGRVRFTFKALEEMNHDMITRADVLESITNATTVHKKIVSKKRRTREKLYVIMGFTSSGLLIYTKGRLHREKEEGVLYILISAKKSVNI